MRKSRLWLMAALLVVFGLLTSACFQIRYLSYWPKALTVGEIAKVKVNLFPVATSIGVEAYVVILVGLDDLDLDSVSDFDMLGNWGGPYTSSQLVPLETLMLTNGECREPSSGVDAQDFAAGYPDWYAIRSNNLIDASGLTAADLERAMRVNIKVERPAGTASNGYGSMVIFTGGWGDLDTDGVPDSGEVVCTGMLTMTIPFRP